MRLVDIRCLSHASFMVFASYGLLLAVRLAAAHSEKIKHVSSRRAWLIGYALEDEKLT